MINPYIIIFLIIIIINNINAKINQKKTMQLESKKKNKDKLVIVNNKNGKKFFDIRTMKLKEINDNIMNEISLAIDTITLSSLSYTGICESIYLPLPSPRSLWSRLRGSINNETEQKLHVLNFKGSGTLAPVVLLHGISSCASDYYPLIMFLQTKCSRVVAIDLPGHGKTVVRKDSTLRELEDLMIEGVDLCLKKLKIGQCTLIGNSLGGFVAAKYASLHSNNLRSLVLISPAGAPLTEDELDTMRKIFKMETFADAMKFLDVVIGRQRLPIGMRQVISLACRARARRPTVQRILQEATIATRLSVREAANIKCPILLIWGEKEEIFSTDHLEWFSKNLKPTLIYRPKGIGHVPHLDAKVISNSIFTFLQSNGKYYD